MSSLDRMAPFLPRLKCPLVGWERLGRGETEAGKLLVLFGAKHLKKGWINRNNLT